MYTTAQLTQQLTDMGIAPGDTLLVHSSMKSVGEVDGGADAVLDALCSCLKDGLLLIPTHTWDTVWGEHKLYDPKTEPSCTGILGTLLLRREGAVRTLHPSHSMAVWGRDAESFAEGEHRFQTPCARGGCMGKLLDRGGKVLFVGVPLSKNTFIHGVEEWNNIENRLAPPETRYIVMPDGSIFVGAMCHHNSPVRDISVNYAKLEQPFLSLGVAREGRLGDARCVLCGCEGMFRVTSELLKNDPDLFLTPDPVDKRLVDALR